MRFQFVRRWLLTLAVASGLTATAHAQPYGKKEDKKEDKRDKDWKKDDKRDTRKDDKAPYAGGAPKQPPPPLKVEKQPARKGQVWISGHWDWKGGTWEWTAGRWEPAKPGRKPEPVKWEKKGDVFVKVDFKWVDVPPPARREEPQAKTPRPGQSWQSGHWEWDGNNWGWVNGKLVAERKGKKWRDSAWTKKGDEWVESQGDWEDDKARGRDSKDTYAGDAPKNPPPPRKQEARPAPRKGEAWIAGNWDWKDGTWEWTPGRWVPAKPGRRPKPADWEKKNNVWVKIDVSWTDIPLPPRRDEPASKIKRPNQSWQSGQWEWNGNTWDWAPGKWVPEVKGKKWRDTVWTKKGDEWVETKGDWEDDRTAAKDPPRDPKYRGDAPKTAPPTRVEPRPAAKKGEVWIAGHHDWKNGTWEWTPGRWEPAKPGRRAEPPRWEKKGDVFVKVDLRWVDVPPPARREEPQARTPKPGQAWQSGHWEWDGNNWGWVNGKWVPEVKGKKWRDSTWTKKGDEWVETKGDWEDAGPAVKPKPIEKKIVPGRY